MHPLIDLAIKLDPSLILDEMGLDPDPWQRQVLRSDSDKMLINVHRQVGKSTTTAGLAITTAIQEDDVLILLVSRSLRQSGELFRKVVRAYKRLGSPIPATEDNSITLALSNGSRIVSLPNSADTIVGFSAPKLVIVDEAARTSDEIPGAVLPMFATAPGRFVGMSTPKGLRGWWAEAWADRQTSWERIEFWARDNVRIDPAWLAEQRLILGPRWYAQEFEGAFNDSEGQVFSEESITAAFTSDRPALFEDMG